MTQRPSARTNGPGRSVMKLPAAAYSAEAAASAAKAGSCGVSCEILRPVGQSLWAACRSRYPPSPRLRRVLLAFIPAAAYSAEVATSATKAGSYGVFGEGESHDTKEMECVAVRMR